MQQRDVFHKINGKALLKVFKALGLLLNCSPMVVVAVDVAPVGGRMATKSRRDHSGSSSGYFG